VQRGVAIGGIAFVLALGNSTAAGAQSTPSERHTATERGRTMSGRLDTLLRRSDTLLAQRLGGGSTRSDAAIVLDLLARPGSGSDASRRLLSRLDQIRGRVAAGLAAPAPPPPTPQEQVTPHEQLPTPQGIEVHAATPPVTTPPRVLTRPGAAFHNRPGGVPMGDVPVFSVLYVFEEADAEREPWLRVGPDPDGTPEGWIRKRHAQEWKNMLVMRYAPASDRHRALFFRRPETIRRLIEDFDFASLARRLYQQVETGTYDPETLVAIEPERSVNQAENPYLMPILDWIPAEFDSGFETTLLELAGVNLDTRPAEAGRDGLPGNVSRHTEPSIENLRVGLVFVIDTTSSMGPHIEQTKRFVADIYERLARAGIADRFRFGLVGYRDNPDAASGVDYVTRIFRDLDPAADMRMFTDQVFDIEVSRASTQNWREDAFAGLEDAILHMSWDQVDARIVFLITDASARGVGDLLARDPAVGASTIVGLADQNDIALIILHMQTEQARRVSQQQEGYDDHIRGQTQYSRMQVTGNQIDTKYFQVSGETAERFEWQLRQVADKVIEKLRTFQTGQTIQQARLADAPQEEEELLLLSQSSEGMLITDDRAAVVSAAVVNEIFRAQQEYLGHVTGTKAPAFYRAWAADRDLVDPRFKPFEVSVFMTRAQISDLANRLDDIVARLDNKEAGFGEFFSTVRDRSGRVIVDPKIKFMLPSFLEELPYRSKFVELDQDTWEALGAGQEELLQEVRSKIALYRRMTSGRDGWLDLSDRSTESEVYPMPLRFLP